MWDTIKNVFPKSYLCIIVFLVPLQPKTKPLFSIVFFTAFSSKLGYEEHIPGQTRDWNEELQTTRELGRKTLPERLLRERAIFKVHSDFVTAATRGAMAVIDGNVMAINPGEDSKMQMFIWNNIFFSLGFDVRDHYKELGGDAAAFVAPVSRLKVFTKRIHLYIIMFIYGSILHSSIDTVLSYSCRCLFSFSCFGDNFRDGNDETLQSKRQRLEFESVYMCV